MKLSRKLIVTVIATIMASQVVIAIAADQYCTCPQVLTGTITQGTKTWNVYSSMRVKDNPKKCTTDTPSSLYTANTYAVPVSCDPNNYCAGCVADGGVTSPGPLNVTVASGFDNNEVRFDPAAGPLPAPLDLANADHTWAIEVPSIGSGVTISSVDLCFKFIVAGNEKFARGRIVTTKFLYKGLWRTDVATFAVECNGLNSNDPTSIDVTDVHRVGGKDGHYHATVGKGNKKYRFSILTTKLE